MAPWEIDGDETRSNNKDKDQPYIVKEYKKQLTHAYSQIRGQPL